MRGALRRRGSGDHGAVVMLVALALPVLLLMTAFSVDLGRQRSSRRNMQAKADVIALDLARLINGSTASNISYSAPLAASAARNNLPLSKVKSVQFGTLDAATKKFVACGVPATCVPTSVRVTTTEAIGYFFQRGTGSTTRSAVGTQDTIAGIAVGSFAAGVNSGSSPLLNTLIGNALHLGVLGYSGLANSSLTYLGLASQLGLGTPSDLFNTNVTAFQALQAAAQILAQNSANAAQVAVLNQVLAVPNSPLKNVTVGQIVHVEAGGENAALGSTFNVLDLLAGGAFLANGSSALTLPSTLLNVPGLTSNVSLTLVQSPQQDFGHLSKPIRASTSQANLTVGFTLGTGSVCASTTDLVNLLTSLLGTVVNLLTTLLTAPVCNLLNRNLGLTVDGTVTVALAKATGTVTSIGCAAPQTMNVSVQSGLVHTDLALSVKLRAGVTNITPIGVGLHTTGTAPTGSVGFTIPPDQFGKFKPSNPGSGTLGLDSNQLSTQGLGLLLQPVLNLVAPVTTALNNNLIVPLSNLLGLRIAGADVAPLQIDCTGVQLTG